MFSFNKLVFVHILLSLCLVIVVSSTDADHYHTAPRQSQKSAKMAGNPEELETNFWNSNAQNLLKDKIKATLNTNVAKNVIIFIGDGMSLETVVATRIMVSGEEGLLSFEKFPHFGLSKTYCVNKQVADSACSATAYLSGVKGNYGTIGVNAKVPRYNCDAGLDKTTHTKSIASWAQDACKATGLVTTTRVTHASPAGNFANIADRNWENDAEIIASECDPEKIDDIAEQLIRGDVGKNFQVILGGGRRQFIPTTTLDEEGKAGVRTDGVNLIDEWNEERNKDGRNAKYIWNKKQLLDIDIENTDYLLGLFENNHCLYNADIVSEGLEEDEPKLTDMVEVAIKMLQKEENTEGYYLFVEGGRIDMAHHDNKARKALLETEEFAKAVELARSMTSEEDTLIVVTADHSHTLTINGYPDRGSDILGLTGDNADDGKPYLTLSYANGPSYKNTYDSETGERIDLRGVDISSNDFLYSAAIPLTSETHGGDDVGVYASGPWSHLFVGNYEQNVIPYLAAYAGKLGEYAEVEETTESPETTESLETKETPETTESLETTESPETTESLETPETTESLETTESPETTESLETKETPDTTESLETTESPETTESLETKETPETTESLETTESPETTDTSETQGPTSSSVTTESTTEGDDAGSIISYSVALTLLCLTPSITRMLNF